MPVKPGEPLIKVTLNLYEADVAYLKRVRGEGYTGLIRHIVRKDITAHRREYDRDNQITRLGDLDDDR